MTGQPLVDALNALVAGPLLASAFAGVLALAIGVYAVAMFIGVEP